MKIYRTTDQQDSHLILILRHNSFLEHDALFRALSHIIHSLKQMSNFPSSRNYWRLFYALDKGEFHVYQFPLYLIDLLLLLPLLRVLVLLRVEVLFRVLLLVVFLRLVLQGLGLRILLGMKVLVGL